VAFIFWVKNQFLWSYTCTYSFLFSAFNSVILRIYNPRKFCPTFKLGSAKIAEENHSKLQQTPLDHDRTTTDQQKFAFLPYNTCYNRYYVKTCHVTSAATFPSDSDTHRSILNPVPVKRGYIPMWHFHSRWLLWPYTPFAARNQPEPVTQYPSIRARLSSYF